MKKKLLIYSALLCVSTVALPGCNKNKGNDEYEGDRLILNLRNLYFSSWDAADSYTEIIQDKFKVKIVPSSYDYNSWDEQVSGEMYGGGLKDAFHFDLESFNFGNTYYKWANDGSIKAIPDDLSRWPHIKNIINNTQDLSVAVVEVGTEYNESILRIEEAIEKGLPEMKEHIPAIVEGPFYKGVQSLGESSVNIKLVAKCKEEDKYQVERDLNREIKLLFDANKINVPFNQIVLNTRDPNEPDKTQYKPKMASTKNFAQEQGELSKDIEEQLK